MSILVYQLYSLSTKTRAAGCWPREQSDEIQKAMNIVFCCVIYLIASLVPVWLLMMTPPVTPISFLSDIMSVSGTKKKRKKNYHLHQLPSC